MLIGRVDKKGKNKTLTYLLTHLRQIKKVKRSTFQMGAQSCPHADPAVNISPVHDGFSMAVPSPR